MTSINLNAILLFAGIALFVAFAAYYAKRKRRAENRRLAGGAGAPEERRTLT